MHETRFTLHNESDLEKYFHKLITKWSSESLSHENIGVYIYIQYLDEIGTAAIRSTFGSAKDALRGELDIIGLCDYIPDLPAGIDLHHDDSVEKLNSHYKDYLDVVIQSAMSVGFFWIDSPTWIARRSFYRDDYLLHPSLCNINRIKFHDCKWSSLDSFEHGQTAASSTPWRTSNKSLKRLSYKTLQRWDVAIQKYESTVIKNCLCRLGVLHNDAISLDRAKVIYSDSIFATLKSELGSHPVGREDSDLFQRLLNGKEPLEYAPPFLDYRSNNNHYAAHFYEVIEDPGPWPILSINPKRWDSAYSPYKQDRSLLLDGSHWDVVSSNENGSELYALMCEIQDYFFNDILFREMPDDLNDDREFSELNNKIASSFKKNPVFLIKAPGFDFLYKLEISNHYWFKFYFTGSLFDSISVNWSESDEINRITNITTHFPEIEEVSPNEYLSKFPTGELSDRVQRMLREDGEKDWGIFRRKLWILSKNHTDLNVDAL